MGAVKVSDHFNLVDLNNGGDSDSEFAEAVREGLCATPKSLPCQYFYDEAGSALFEQICDLPEYYLTRAEREILTTHADAIVHDLPQDIGLVELGSGSATKTRLLIDALLKKQSRLRFTPIDISKSALEQSGASLLAHYASLEIAAVAAEYKTGLDSLKVANSGPELIIWLGSSIGNLTRREAIGFMGEIRQAMTEDDRFLVGIDLRKPARILESAYDDFAGVTTAFNKNVLKRVNAELGGSFDLDLFDHLAKYDEDEGRIEMHLVSKVQQTVSIGVLDLKVQFADGETIHTENSYKYSLEEIRETAAGSGLALDHQWFDAGKRFSLNLLSAKA